MENAGFCDIDAGADSRRLLGDVERVASVRNRIIVRMFSFVLFFFLVYARTFEYS